MVDFTAKLKEQRAKEALEKQLAKVKKTSAPNMNPFSSPGWKKEKEPPPPDISTFNVGPAARLKLKRLVHDLADITLSQRQDKRAKKPLAEDVKKLCKLYDLSKFMVEGDRVAFYRNDKSTISKELLLAAGVQPNVIEKCTITKESWALRVMPGIAPEEEEDGGDSEEEA